MSKGEGFGGNGLHFTCEKNKDEALLESNIILKDKW